MLLLSKIDFIEEIKAEMAGYEELTQELISDWVKHFEKYLQKPNPRDKRVSIKGQIVNIKLDDESDLFGIVDKYLAAVDAEEIDAYWSEWHL
jgi:hypothetical protein